MFKNTYSVYYRKNLFSLEVNLTGRWAITNYGDLELEVAYSVVSIVSVRLFKFLPYPKVSKQVTKDTVIWANEADLRIKKDFQKKIFNCETIEELK